MNRAFVWFYMLCKRLFLKPAFLCILLLVPVLLFMFGFFSNDDKGVVKISIYPGTDSNAVGIVNEIVSEDSIILFYVTESEEIAVKEVRSGKADAAWIFSDDFSKIIKEKKGKTIVKSVQREDNPLLMLASLRLYTSLYPEFTYSAFSENVHSIEELSALDENSLKKTYDRYITEDSLFEMRYENSFAKAEEGSDYLSVPLKGLLLVWVILAGLSGGLFFFEDEGSGLFSSLRHKEKAVVSLIYQFVPVFISSLVMLIAMPLADRQMNFGKEALLTLIYMFTVTCFCDFIRVLFGKKEILGGAVPVILIVMLVCCPIFVSFQVFEKVQYILPPALYLLALNSTEALYRLFILGAVCFLLSIFLRYMRKNI